MNISKTFCLIILLTALAVTNGCEEYLGNDINANPNGPTEVSISVIIPAVQVNIADVTGGDMSRFASTIVQQTEGVSRAWASFYSYASLTPSSFNTLWNNVYENILIELKLAINIAEERGFNHHKAISEIMMAYTLMMATDVWDDIPYSEALNGVDLLSPQFDSQSSIYAEVEAMLNQAIDQLGGDAGDLSIGTEDFYYAGDVAQWTKAAYALLARMHLHLGNYTEALTAIDQSFTSAADNLQYQFPDNTNAAPWYRFNRDREGDIEFNMTMGNIMANLNDTDRLAIFNPTFVTEHPYFRPDATQELISYRELLFIEAECHLRTGSPDSEVRDAYIRGIEASFQHLQLAEDASSAYLAQATINPSGTNITLEQIIIQKYIGLFTHPEVFSDWRRTNVPTLTPVRGTNVPVRFHYGSDEVLFNTNAPDPDDIDIFTDRVWWNR